ncbi:extensin family protein [Altererythrobacter sp. KTW20L]|uniref:extensin-like domain-containing protein n=1 Tax=Altererythrobacter sp. KTW20L TaxID=2942210 RepID=UPI0020BF5CE8|nr:extensin family protein [Altererythrobacter sp. KTW20L]MCL6249634.1 extensin family protein [Altererythrobacter sp. KTW20L]
MRRIAPLLAVTALLSACSVVPESRGSQAPAAPRIQQAAPVAVAPQDRQCLAQLTDTGAQFVPVADAYTGQGCSTVGTVQLTALRSDVTRLSVSNIGPVQCGVGAAFAAWARFGVDRAAQQILGSPLQRIETMGSYACRNVAGSQRRSAHATAGAIDIAAFVLEDGRRISIVEHWHAGTAAEKEFLRTVQRSACRRFATVLGPEYNAAHRDHFHLEGVISGNSFCR